MYTKYEYSVTHKTALNCTKCGKILCFGMLQVFRVSTVYTMSVHSTPLVCVRVCGHILYNIYCTCTCIYVINIHVHMYEDYIET